MEEKRCPNCMEPAELRICPHCGADTLEKNAFHQLQVGTVLRGRYRVGRVLGQGGFGITYMGWDENLDVPIAIKEYFPNGYVSRSNKLSATIDQPTTTDRKEFFEKGIQKK